MMGHLALRSARVTAHLSPRCLSCYLMQQLPLPSFHTAAHLQATKLYKSKKKIIDAVSMKKKPLVKLGPAVPIRPEMTVAEIAERLGKDVDHVYDVLDVLNLGRFYDQPDSVISDMVVLEEICKKSGFKSKREVKKKESSKENKDATKRSPPDPADLVKRPPVVTIMGHVDHGKTTLLDNLRHSHIVDQEFGGITQHIGAFSVTLESGDNITFLDTPGHAAFSSMRSRGAHLTDIVVLVVAGDDGIMQQTVESIKHAQDAKVPIVVAINKCDKPECDVEMTKRQLGQHGLMLEDYGGDVQAIPISALKGTNVRQLQEAIAALAEVMEVKGDPTGLVEGAVIESRSDVGKGKVATVLVQRGTLKKGANLVAGCAWAKVRTMYNDSGKPVSSATPGQAVEVTGWRELPSAGDDIIELEKEHRVREVITWRKEREAEEKARSDMSAIREKREQHQRQYEQALQERRSLGFRRKMNRGTPRPKETVENYTGPQLSIIVKGDVDGSLEAILDVLGTFSSNECRLDLIHWGVGAITQQDIELAEPFGGIIYAFNVDCPPKLKSAADAKNVEILHFNVIYKMMDDLKERLREILPYKEQDVVLGKANVLQIFKVKEKRKKLVVAGCKCTEGTLKRSGTFKLVRGGEVLFEGRCFSMKHIKNEVESVRTNVECGLVLDECDIEPVPGDEIWCHGKEQVQQELNWDPGF